MYYNIKILKFYKIQFIIKYGKLLIKVIRFFKIILVIL